MAKGENSMNQNEIENHIEGLIESLMEEGGIDREDAEYDALVNCIYQYDHDQLSREDLLSAAKYLDYELDMSVIDEAKAKHQQQRAYRKAHKASKWGAT